MTDARLRCVVPTCGRASLAALLSSIAAQPPADDDLILVVGDGPQPSAERIVDQWAQGGLPARYLQGPDTHAWGNAQRQYGLERIADAGGWLVFADDDDAFTHDAWADMRAVIRELPEPRPVLGRFVERSGCVLWGGPQVRCGNVSTQSILVPNDPARLGAWTGKKREADYDFLVATLAHYPNGPRWHAHIWQVQGRGVCGGSG